MQIQYKPRRTLLETILHVEILQGLRLTMRHLFSRPITRQYPDEKPEVKNGFRGQHALVRDQKTGTSRCVACMRCATVCPSRCIRIRFHKDPDTGGRTVDSYDIDALRCVFCGYCVEVCPVNALVMTEVFEYADYTREPLFFDQERLLANWDRFIAEKGYDPESYTNPWWRPRGVDEEMLPAGKRIPAPSEWTMAGQVVGRHYQDSEQVAS